METLMKHEVSAIDVMLKNARYWRDQANSAKGDDAVKYRRLAERADRDAAPYLHPREIKLRRGETVSQAILRVVED
jgi:hypothetical protein